jgi:hypothetical protein
MQRIGLETGTKTTSYILIALFVCHVTVMLPVLHFVYITAPG